VNGITRVARVTARLVPHRWVWAEENAGLVADHWARRKADKPAIFNGPVLMIARSRLVDGTLEAEFFETRYASFLTWLDLGFPDRSVQNGFAMGALTASDGAYLLGEMGPHTSQAGRVYFPAGTPDPTDVRPDGTVDLASSITREIEEETGFAPSDYVVEPGWILVREEGFTAFMRHARLPVPAEAARTHILRHLAAEPEPELAGIRIARGVDDIDEHAMPAYLTAFLRWSYREGAPNGA
jgi:8-oxo-dGTP pyrophosphatase MutT (NUDIX family)